MAEYLGKLRFAPVLVMVLASAALAPGQQISDTPRPEMWIANGTVNALAESCGVLYLGGEFTLVGPNTGSFVAIGASKAIVDSGWPKANSVVWAIAPDGMGGAYIGGAFTAIGCAARNYVAHVQANGVLDPKWHPDSNGSVTALAVAGDTVYIGGIFTTIDGQIRNRIAAVDAKSGSLKPWSSNINSNPLSIAVSDDVVYVGGNFTSVGGQLRNRIAALDRSTGATTAWNPNANRAVHALVVESNTVFAGGYFTTIGGQARNRIAALDATTGGATAWNPNASGGAQSGVLALVVSDGLVYAGGEFSTIGGQSRRAAAALDINTGAANAWNPIAFGSLQGLAKSGNTVFAGGGFTPVGEEVVFPNYRLSAFDAATGAPTGWNEVPNNRILTLSVSGGRVLAGGYFTSMGAVTRNRLAALDMTTGTVTDWNPDVGPNGASVMALAVSEDTLYVGGFFNTIGGQPRNYIAALDSSGNVLSNWNPNSDWRVNALAVSGETVYAGGGFFNIGGQPRRQIAALDSDGNALPNWDPDADGDVETLAVSGDTVYAGGWFETIGGQPRSALAALDAISGMATSWDPNVLILEDVPQVYAVTVSGNLVYVAGHFEGAGGQIRNNIAALDATTGTATSWDPNAFAADGASVYALGITGDAICAAGYFTTIGGQPRNALAALDATTGAATDWNPFIEPPLAVVDLAVAGGSIYAGGIFSPGLVQQGLLGFSITNSGWTGASGLWSSAVNWSPPVVPNNTSCDQFNVRIAGASSQVTLDIDATINTLQMEDNALLLITGGDLTIAGGEGVASNAGIFVGPGHALIASTATNVCGANPIEMAGTDAALSSTAAENTIRLSAPVVGFGVIDAAFQNESTIDANTPGKTLKIWGALSATSGGQMRASNGGTLEITRSLGGASAFVADSGGVIDIPGDTPVTVSGSTADLSNGGQWRMGGQAATAFSGDVDIGCGNLRGCTPPVLECTDHSSTQIGGNLLLSGPVDASVGSDAVFELAGDFVNECISPATFHWETGPLTLNGAAPQTFELAGDDLGIADAGAFIDNFAMGVLRVEPGRTVTFRDHFDNIPGPGCEVLYVNTLSLGAGSTIILDGCNVYYRRLINEGATIDLQNGAALMRRSKEVSLADPALH